MIHRPLALALCLLAAGCGTNSSSSKSASTVGASTSAGSTTPVSTTSTTTPLPANFQLVGFETLDVGNDSPRGVAQGAHEVHVGTDADWAFFWPSHSQAQLPVVDFTQESVVGTFMGQMTSGVHNTRVINVSRDANSDDLHALVREFRMGAWRPQPSVLSSPFHLVRCASAVSGQGTLAVDRQANLDFEVLSAGSDSALGAGDPTYTGGLHVMRDAAALSTLYAQVLPGTRPPGIDFQTQMVVAVLGPYIPRFGNTVETLRLVHDPKTDEIRVISRVNPYRGGAAPPPATETPYQFLRVSIASGAIRPEQTTSVTQTPLASGESTLYAGGADTQIVRDAATFVALWAARIGTTPPQVDFAVDQVLIAFQPAASNTIVSVASSELLEDDELSVRVTTQLVFTLPIQSAAYSMVTTPRTFGPVSFETVDVTPRP
jgi:hypothetical protein